MQRGQDPDFGEEDPQWREVAVAAPRVKEGARHREGHKPIDHEGEDSPPETDPYEMHSRSLTLNLASNLRNMPVTRGL